MDEELAFAEPTKLTGCLFRALGERIESAASALEAGLIRERATAISQAVAILGELSQTLRPEVDRELTARLQQIYSFLVERVLYANAHQVVAPLREAQRVVSVLEEAWRGIEEVSYPHAQQPSVTGYDPTDAGRQPLSYCG